MEATSKLYWTVQTYTLASGQSTTRQFTIVPSLNGKGILRWFRLTQPSDHLLGFSSPPWSSYFIITIDGVEYTLPITSAFSTGREVVIPIPFSSSIKLEFFSSIKNDTNSTQNLSQIAEALVYLFQ